MTIDTSRGSAHEKTDGEEGSLPAVPTTSVRHCYCADCVMASLSNATWVCASALPFMVARVCRVMAVLERTIPSKCEVAPSVALI